MKIKLIDITENAIDKIYKSYRICYSKDIYENINIPMINGEKDIDKMCKFIVPLMEEYHTSPLEHVSFTFSIEGLSRAALAQITRHRTFKFNVQSMRYVDGNNFDFALPDFSYLDEEKSKEATEEIEKILLECKENYNKLLSIGAKKEDARAVLPQATTCNLVVTMDLNNFRNFLRQRLCSHAQLEIRLLAKEMNKMVKEFIPFCDYKVLLCSQNLCKNNCKNAQ